MANKSRRRVKMVRAIEKSIMHPDIYGTINYRRMNEAQIKQYMHRYLLDCVSSLYKDDKKCNEDTSIKFAKSAVLWEGNVKTTINNLIFMGTQHRPDMVVEFPKYRIGIEVKKGNAGGVVREGIGQSIVYSTVFDFVICLVVDTSNDKKILNSVKSDKERQVVKSLWNEYNISFNVI